MASFLSAGDISSFQNDIDTHFDTFKRQITIHKEPIKNIVQNSTNQMLGYQEDSNVVDYSYTPRNETFYAIIKYNNIQENLSVDPELKLKFLNQFVEIKVKEDAKNYIEIDRTEKITFDSKTFNLVSSALVKNYLGLSYYTFYLKETT
jgi:hypothetical protein